MAVRRDERSIRIAEAADRRGVEPIERARTKSAVLSEPT
jgi:hypothetical protein